MSCKSECSYRLKMQFLLPLIYNAICLRTHIYRTAVFSFMPYFVIFLVNDTRRMQLSEKSKVWHGRGQSKRCQFDSDVLFKWSLGLLIWRNWFSRWVLFVESLQIFVLWKLQNYFLCKIKFLQILGNTNHEYFMLFVIGRICNHFISACLNIGLC